jgi:hypothetical protein
MRVMQNARHAPRSSLRSSQPPKFLGGALALVFGTQVRKGCHCETHCMFRSAKTRTSNLESKRKGNPHSWGSQTRRLTFAKALWSKESAMIHHGRRRLRGASHAFCTT